MFSSVVETRVALGFFRNFSAKDRSPSSRSTNLFKPELAFAFTAFPLSLPNSEILSEIGPEHAPLPRTNYRLNVPAEPQRSATTLRKRASCTAGAFGASLLLLGEATQLATTTRDALYMRSVHAFRTRY